MKTCKICKFEKSLNDFYIVNKTELKNYYSNNCKKCCNKNRRQYLNQYRLKNKDLVNQKKREYYKKRMDNSLIVEQINNQQRTRYPRYVVKRLFNNALKRALKNNLEFTITLDDIIIPKKCPLLNIDLFTGNKKNYQNSPSLDRIDINKGYIKGNIKVISTLANTMKNSATFEQLLTFSENIKNYITIEEIVRPIEN